MSKSERIRDLQKEVNRLEFELKQANEKIIEYEMNYRTKLKVRDFLEVK